MLTDNQGTVRDIVNNDGGLVEHYRYSAYGTLLEGNTSFTRYQYTGRELDPTTGLQYNGHRWYSGIIGRWLSEDPIGFSGGDTNLYRYVGNGPTNATDPNGLAPVGAAVKSLARGLERLGVRSLFQVHHIIGQSVFAEVRYAAWFGKLGVSADSAKNLIALPNNVVTRALSGRTLHSGRHIGEYVGSVKTKLDDIMDRNSAGAITDDEARSAIAGIQSELRQGLANGTIALRRADLEALAKGQAISVAGLFAIVAEDQWDQAIQAAGYATAAHHLGEDSWTGWLIDIFNPFTLYQDALIVAPYLPSPHPQEIGLPYSPPLFMGP
jgi:RHS repeat-associated protein